MNEIYSQEHMEESIKKFVDDINRQDTRFMSFMKAEFVRCSLEKKELTLKFKVLEWELNSQNSLHGGIISSMFDSTFGFLGHYFSDNRYIATISLTTNYLKPIWKDEEIEVRVKISSLGKKVINLMGEMVIPKRNETIAGTSTASFMILDHKYK